MKNFIYIILILISFTANAQSKQEMIRETFYKYFSSIEKKDNAKTLEFIYPKLFEHFPKDRMLQALNKMKEDTTMSVSFDSTEILKISEPVEVDGIEYALITYKFNMTFSFKEGEDGAKEFILEGLNEKYGKKNVRYNAENNSITARTTNEMYAINDPSYKNWKFLEKKENMMPVLEKILPKKVLKKL